MNPNPSVTSARIQTSPVASRWLQAADASLAERDPVDALRDAETLLQAARERAVMAGIVVSRDDDLVAALRDLVAEISSPGNHFDYSTITRARAALEARAGVAP